MYLLLILETKVPVVGIGQVMWTGLYTGQSTIIRQVHQVRFMRLFEDRYIMYIVKKLVILQKMSKKKWDCNKNDSK